MLAGPPEGHPPHGPPGESPPESTQLRPRPKTRARVPRVDLTHRPPPTLPPLSRTPRGRGRRRPPSFGFQSLIGLSSVLARPPPEPALSLAELPGLIARYGPGVALDDSRWTEGPRLVCTALGADIPVPPVHTSPQPG